MKKYILNNVFGLIVTMVLLCVVIAMSGCKTIQVVPEIHTEYVHDTISRVDSVWRDRVHTEYMRGDTVYIHDSVWNGEYKWRDKYIEVCKTDSVPYPVEVKEYVTQNSNFAKFCMWHTIVIWIAILLAAAIWLGKRLR